MKRLRGLVHIIFKKHLRKFASLVTTTVEVNLSTIDSPNNRMQKTVENFQVENQTLYGSESNLSYGEGRVSEISKNKRMSTNARVGDQNLYGPGPSGEITYEEGNLRQIAMPMRRN